MNLLICNGAENWKNAMDLVGLRVATAGATDMSVLSDALLITCSFKELLEAHGFIRCDEQGVPLSPNRLYQNSSLWHFVNSGHGIICPHMQPVTLGGFEVGWYNPNDYRLTFAEYPSGQFWVREGMPIDSSEIGVPTRA